MKKILAFIFLFSFSTSSYAEDVLQQQNDFVSVIRQSQIEAQSAKNEMQLGGIKAKRDTEIKKVLKKSPEYWIGIVSKVSANGDGKGILGVKLDDKLEFKTWNNSFSDSQYETLIEPGTELFSEASSLSVGDRVKFTGHPFKDGKGNMKEASMSLSGSVQDPEFIFKFKSIKKID